MSATTPITVMTNSGEYGFSSFYAAYDFATHNNGEIFVYQRYVDGTYDRAHVSSVVKRAVVSVFRTAGIGEIGPTTGTIENAAETAVQEFLASNGWTTVGSMILYNIELARRSDESADAGHDGE